MRVYYDPQTFLRQRSGGISRLFTDLVREFDESPEFGIQPVLPFKVSNNQLAASALSHRRVHATPQWLPRAALYGPWWLRGPRRWQACDVVHPTYYSRRFLPHRSRAKFVVTVYDMIPEIFSGTGLFTGSHLAKRDYVMQADLVICISESTRRDMRAIYGDIAQRTAVIPLAVDSGFRPGLPPVSGFPADYLLYVGKRGGYKDFGLMPEVLELLQDLGLSIPLVVVGEPPKESELRSFRGTAAAKVLWVRLSDEELKRAYSNCSALVQTSRYEGFGLTPLEGMASGVPVVVADSSSMPEVGGDVAVYFKPGDAVDLAAAILQCLENDLGRSQRVQRGIDRAAKFTTKALASRTAAEYQALING